MYTDRVPHFPYSVTLAESIPDFENRKTLLKMARAFDRILTNCPNRS